MYDVHQFPGELSGGFACRHVAKIAHQLSYRVRKPGLQLV